MYILIKHIKNRKNNLIFPIVLTETEYEAYLQLLIEAEPLYESHIINKEEDNFKSFTSNGETINLIIKYVAKL